MKLRNKKTGEVVECSIIPIDGNGYVNESLLFENGDSIEELNKNWEDYEEPKEYWFITSCGAVEVYTDAEQPAVADMHKQFGNYFESEEEAEKAVERLKAITRLNKCGLRFEGYDDRDRANGGDIVIYAHVDIPNNNLLEEAQPDMLKDLDLLFGGEK